MSKCNVRNSWTILLLHKCRSSDRLHRLVCDRVVWLHLLKQTAEFSKEKLEELVKFVPKKGRGRSELMAEVLRTAASKFPPSYEYDPEYEEGPRPLCPAKILWTVEG